MTIEEILALESVDDKIQYLKKGRKTEVPDREKLYNDWNPNHHEIMTDKEKYPDIKITTKPEETIYNETTGKKTIVPAQTQQVAPNRIALPIEQDIVNIQTAFTVGEEPKLNCSPSDNEKNVLETLKIVLKKNKIKYQNKKIIRSWLSEQECAEYWYVTKDDGFWAKLMTKINAAFGKAKPEYKLRSVLWSPFRGDKLYPFFNEENDLVGFSREYKKKDIDGNEIQCFMTITGTKVYNWEFTTDWKETSFNHGFDKLPVLYCYRSEPYCEKIKSIRIRLEKLISSYADCIDYHFFPILKLFGDVTTLSGNFKNRIVNLTGEGADAQYLTWQQASETVKLELDSLTEKIYSMTNTPRIMPEALHQLGNSFSGVSFRYMFMGAHLSVENHAEEIGEFMQRRVNFLIHALGKVNTAFESASNTIDIDVEIQPYMIDSISDNVSTAVNAVNGGVWSRKEGIMFCGNIDRVDEVYKEIMEEKQEDAQMQQSMRAQSVK